MSHTNPLLKSVIPPPPDSATRPSAFGPGKTQILYMPQVTGVALESAPPPLPEAPPSAPVTPRVRSSVPPPFPASAESGQTQIFGSVLPAPPRSGAPVITQFLPVEQLLSRAVAARTLPLTATVPPAVAALPPLVATPPTLRAPLPRFPEFDPSIDDIDIPMRTGVGASVWRRLRGMSGISRASLVLLLLVVAVFASGRWLKRTANAAPAARAAASATVAPEASARPETGTPSSTITPEPAAAPVPPGLERRAVDALAEGRDEAALALYRDLAARQPQNAAFREAVRLIERRTRPAGE